MMIGCRSGAKRYLTLGRIIMSVTLSARSTAPDALEGWVERLLAEYAQTPIKGPLPPGLSLRDDLAIESLSLVSLVVRLGDELGVDAADESLELQDLATVGDLLALARRLDQRAHASGA
jgi:acyl carrier protein